MVISTSVIEGLHDGVLELAGKPLSDDTLAAAGRAAAAQCDPSADLRGSVEYKRDLTRILIRRAVAKAAARARGEA